MPNSWSIAIAGVLLGLASNVYGWNGGYSPGYEPYPQVKLYPSDTLIDENSADPLVDRFAWRSPEGQTWHVTFTRCDSPWVHTLRVISPQDTYAIADSFHFYYVREVYHSDLNRDKKPDFLAVLLRMGNGLGSEYSSTLIALSSNKGYDFVQFYSMGFGQEDLIDYHSDGHCQLVSTTMVDTDQGRDGKAHCYWVYRFFTFSDNALVPFTELAPKWIMYAGKTNHKATANLTDSIKQALLAKDNSPYGRW